MTNEKLLNTLEKSKMAMAVASAFITAGLANANTILCDLNIVSDKVSVTSMPTTENVAGGVLTIIAGVARLAGMFMVAGGIVKYLQAKHEENSSGESKAATGIGIGIAFTLMPSLLGAIFT